MERIKTRIIIAVAERLSAAKDSNAKTELIEELSENLYQRYADLTAGGMSEEEAYSRAMEDLGDVSELMEYLRDMENGEAGKSAEHQNREHFNDFFKGMEDVIRETISQTKDAVDQAKIITRDISKKFNERYPDGIKVQIGGFDITRSGRTGAGRPVEVTQLPVDGVKALDIQLHNGDVNVSVLAQDHVEVKEVNGGADDLEIRLSDDGVLYVRQGKTASSSVVFGRGLARTDVELTLPDKVWDFVRINTVNGDVQLDDALEANELNIQTVSGDISADRACCPQMILKSVSGDISGDDMAGNVLAESKSGDVAFSGRFVEVKASSMSGDVELNGTADLVTCGSMSGDVTVEVEVLPREMKVSSKSGDCCARIPAGEGFTVEMHTVSGDLNTDFELVGTFGRKSGSAVYLDGGDRIYSIRSISGDVALEKR